ncbi:MAG: ATP-binding protein [Deltaproteobacteria bacterium]
MSIGQRLAVLVVLAVAACMMVFGAYNARVRSAELMGDAIQDAAEVGSTLDVVLNEVLGHHDLPELAHLPDEISRAERIYGLAVFDIASGDVITSRSVTRYREQLRELAVLAIHESRAVARRSVLNGTSTAAYAFPLRRGSHGIVGAAVVVRDLTSEQTLLRASTLRMLAIGILLGLVTFFVVLLVTQHTVTRPVERLIGGVRRIGEGNLKVPIGLTSHDEMGSIGGAIDRLMNDLESARGAQRREVEARVELEKNVELERRMQHAQRLAAVGQIAASLAHEIGSPLHVIAGRARYAADRDDVAELKENLLVIATQADRITRVVEQLLSVARRRSPRPGPVALVDVARSATDLLGPQARSLKVDLSLRVDSPEIPTIQADPDSLQQVVFNLVLNAIQAQPGGGVVEVAISTCSDRDSLGTERDSLAIEVRDRGPGVLIEQREKIFEPFATSKEGSGGTGLGLAVVRGIVRDHGGTIRLLDNPGGGAIFRVTLPMAED